MSFELLTKHSMPVPIFDGKYFCCEIQELLSETFFLVMIPTVREKQKREKRVMVIFNENSLPKLGQKYDRYKYNFPQENLFAMLLNLSYFRHHHTS